MKAIRNRLGVDAHAEGGLSLVEVMVAMLIFAIIAIGIGYALISTLTIARDNKSREVGSHLAAAEIDRVRALGDPFAVRDGTKSVSVTSTETFTVETTAAWATPTGNVDTCGTAGGPLQYKRVTVKVTWPGMWNEDNPVLTDTLLAPSKRINDPLKGTILVSISDAFGRGKSGVTFTVTPSTGIGAVVPTDSDGCSFILQAPPGNYTIALTNSGMVDAKTQSANPSDTKTVVAGSSTSYDFTYDARARYKMNYASNIPGATRPLIPTNLDYTFMNTYGIYYKKATLAGSNYTVDLHPFDIGYQVVAGKYVETLPACTSVDPESWAPDTRVSPALTATRLTAIPTSPGGNEDIDIPMGGVTVKGGGGQRFLTAVSQPTVLLPGQPSCSSAMTYDFGSVIPTSGSSNITVALPFGTWKLYTRSSATGALTLLNTGNVSLTTSGSAVNSSTGEFALDPR